MFHESNHCNEDKMKLIFEITGLQLGPFLSGCRVLDWSSFLAACVVLLRLFPSQVTSCAWSTECV